MSRIARQHRVDDAGFPGARGRGDDEEGSAHGVSRCAAIRCSGPVRGSGRSAPSARPRHCVVRASTDLLPSVFASRLNSCSRKSRRRPTGFALLQHAAQLRRRGCRGGRVPRRRRASAARSPVPVPAGPGSSAAAEVGQARFELLRAGRRGSRGTSVRTSPAMPRDAHRRARRSPRPACAPSRSRAATKSSSTASSSASASACSASASIACDSAARRETAAVR